MTSLRSLRARLLLLTAAAVLAAVVATAIVTAELSRRVLEREARASLATDGEIYGDLAEYGMTHASWEGAEDVVARLAARTGRRIAIVPDGGRPAIDSASDRPLPSRATARLNDDAALPVPVASGVVQAVGVGPAFEVAVSTAVETADPAAPAVADPAVQALAERTAAGVETCLRRAGVASVRTVDADGRPRVAPAAGADAPSVSATYLDCVVEASRAAIAPPASLYLGDGAGLLDLVGPGWLRLLVLAGGVLLAVLPAAILLGRRLTRPLERVRRTAERLAAGDSSARVGIAGEDEVGTVARALDGLAASLERAERARAAMVRDVAHELRNPLVTLGGTIEAVRDGVYPADAETIGALLEETEQLHRLVDDLDDLARVDAGALRLVPEPTDMAALARGVAEAHRALADAAGVAIAVPAPGAPEALVDPARTRQIVANLVGNAIRHTPPGGAVRIDVATRGDAVEVAVVDTGYGIDAADLPLVFDRFWRADPARARATGGSGLGLAIARELAEVQGGGIGVASTPGHGSSFTVRLPACTPTAPA